MADFSISAAGSTGSFTGYPPGVAHPAVAPDAAAVPPTAAQTVSQAAAGKDVLAPAAAPNAPQNKDLPGDPLSPQKIQAAVTGANKALEAIGTQMVFVFDDQAHHMAVKLLDIQTQKVVQQIPSAAMPATASALSGPSVSGALVDTSA